MKSKVIHKRLFIKVIALAVTMAFLCQNFAWANNFVLAPSAGDKDTYDKMLYLIKDKHSKKHGIKPPTLDELRSKLFAVHRTLVFPKNGILKAGAINIFSSTYDVDTKESKWGEEQASFRPVLHFSLGELVPDDVEGWRKKHPYAVVLPFKELEQKLVNVSPYDTMILGDFKLPKETVLLVPEGTDVSEIPNYIQIEEYSSEIGLKAATDRVIKQKQGWQIRMVNRADIGAVAYLGDLEINNREFFAALLEKYPYLSYGNDISSEKGDAFRFGVINQAIHYVMENINGFDLLEIKFLRAIIMHNLERLEDTIKSQNFSIEEMKVFDMKKKQLMKQIELIDEKIPHKVQDIRGIKVKFLTNFLCMISLKELEEFISKNKEIFKKTDLQKFYAEYAIHRWIIVKKERAIQEGLDNLIKESFDKMIQDASIKTKGDWPLNVIDSFLSYDSNRLNTALEILENPSIRKYLDKFNGIVIPKSPLTLKDFLRVHPVTKILFTQILVDLNKEQKIAYDILKKIGQVFQPSIIDEKLKDFSKSHTLALEVKDSTMQLKYELDTIMKPMFTKSKSLVGGRLNLYELIRRDSDIVDVMNKLGLEKEFREMFPDEAYFWISDLSFYEIYHNLVKNKEMNAAGKSKFVFLEKIKKAESIDEAKNIQKEFKEEYSERGEEKTTSYFYYLRKIADFIVEESKKGIETFFQVGFYSLLLGIFLISLEIFEGHMPRVIDHGIDTILYYFLITWPVFFAVYFIPQFIYRLVRFVKSLVSLPAALPQPEISPIPIKDILAHIKVVKAQEEKEANPASKSQVKEVYEALERQMKQKELKGTLEEDREARWFLVKKLGIIRFVITYYNYRKIIKCYGYRSFMELYKSAGENSYGLFRYGLPAVKETFKEELKEYWPDLVELGIAAGENSGYFFVPALKQTFTGKEFKEYWPDLVELGIAAGENSMYLFYDGLPAVKTLITDRESLVKIGNDLLKIFQVCVGVESKTAYALEELTPLIEKYPLSWNNFIKPVVYKQTVGAFLCFQEVKKLYDMNAITSEDDLAFIKEIIEGNSVRAYDILSNFMVKGVKEGVISKPISADKDLINNYFKVSPYAIIEIYQAYKSNPEDLKPLIAKCEDIHQKIIDGDTAGVEKDPLFGAMLMHVFPPAVTTEREQYMNLYTQRPDRSGDTEVVPLTLQGNEFEVSTGRYILKDPSKPLDETSWHTILKTVKEVNKEEKMEFSEEDIQNLGKELLESWQSNKLRSNREEILKKLYRYFRYTQGQTLPDTLGIIQNIMAVKQYVGDTMRDLVDQCTNKYKENNPETYKEVINKMFKKPETKAKAVLGVVKKYSKQPEDGKKRLDNMLQLNDPDMLDKIWEEVKDMRDVRSIREVLKGITITMQGGKEAVTITQILQGKEYKAMQGEVTAKYEFKESMEKIKLRCVTSKRKAHGAIGLNMGVCVAPDEKLWDNPNFMNVILFDEDNIAQGGMHVLIIEEDDGKKYLTLPGINPSIGLLSQVPADDIYNKLIAYAHELARELNCEGVLIPKETNIHSNRSEIQRVVSGKNYEEITLSKIHPFSYDPYKYSLQGCYVVPVPVKAQPAKKKDIDSSIKSTEEIEHAA